MVHCLLTGGSGFLGRKIASHLTRQGCNVTVLGRRHVAGYHTVLVDLESDEWSELPDGIEQIYHVAGLAHQRPRNMTDVQRFAEVNREGTRRLLSRLDHVRYPSVTTFVFISSVSVYGAAQGTLLDEKTPRKAVEPYGVSKREAEDLVMGWGERTGRRVTIIRLPLVVGSGAIGNLGAMTWAMRHGWYFGVGSGAARRSMVLASDVARVIQTAGQTGGVFHLTDGHHPSFLEVETALAAALGRRSPLRIPRWAARALAHAGDLLQAITNRPLPMNSLVLQRMTSSLTFCDQRARDVLGWNPMPVVEAIGELAIV